MRGDRNADGTFTWTPVAGDQKKDGARYTFGIDPERTRSGAANLMVFNDYLYIGEYNDEEIALERVLFSKTGKNRRRPVWRRPGLPVPQRQSWTSP